MSAGGEWTAKDGRGCGVGPGGSGRRRSDDLRSSQREEGRQWWSKLGVLL